MELSKYIYITDSYDEKNRLLYNSKNGYFVKYNISDFGDISNFISNVEITDFLSGKDFFKSEDEEEQLLKVHTNALKSEDRIMLILKITKNCNFRCSYCYEKFQEEKLDEYNQDIVLEFVRSRLSEKKIKNLQVSWFGGEPL